MSSLLYDMILMEADKIAYHRQKDLELYYKDKKGEIVPLAEAYSPEVEDIIKQLSKRKRMRYFITFADGLKKQNELTQSANRIIRLLVGDMGYDNKAYGWSLRDIQSALTMNMTLVLKNMKVLCGEDIVRYHSVKNKRTYMVNPAYFYRGTFKGLFMAVKRYENDFPKRDFKLNIIK